MTDVIGYGGQRFNRLAGGGTIGVPGIDVGEALKGCCNGIFKFAYIVSAPLHKQGFFDFWASPELSIADKAAVAGDLLLHLCFWFVPFAFELWGSLQDKRGNYIAQELQQGSLWCLIVALIGILVATLFGLMEQDVGKLYATTYAAIVGGGMASILFSLLYFLVAPGNFPELYTAHSSEDAVCSWRFMLYWSIALKVLAVTTARQNAAFWGPCKQEKPMAMMEMAEPKAALSLGVATKA